MIDWNELNCRSMLENYYAALLKREEQKHINHEKKAKTAEELEDLKEKIEKKQIHSLRVLAFCRDIAAVLTESNPKPGLNETMLYAAALLHDIAKFDSNKYHHRLAASAVKTVCGPYGPEDSAGFFALDEIITAHKTRRFAPCPEYAAEAAILRMADKLDEIYRKTQKVQEAEAGVIQAEQKFEKAAHNEKPKKAAKKLQDKEEKLIKREASLEKAKVDFIQNREIIHTFFESEHHGGCDSTFYKALCKALALRCDSLLNF